MRQIHRSHGKGAARHRFDLADCLVIHRYGELRPGEQIVLVIALSAHRQSAFAAAAFIMDYLKTSAPFWKKETTNAGSHWVEAKDSDEAATRAWFEQQAPDESKEGELNSRFLLLRHPPPTRFSERRQQAGSPHTRHSSGTHFRFDASAEASYEVGTTQKHVSAVPKLARDLITSWKIVTRDTS